MRIKKNIILCVLKIQGIHDCECECLISLLTRLITARIFILIIEMNECELGTTACSQICTNTDGSYECSCRAGFRLDHDLHNCVDVDECLVGAPGCWGRCRNTQGR